MKKRGQGVGGREDAFNEDSCCEGLSCPLCGPVNKPGRQTDWEIDQWKWSTRDLHRLSGSALDEVDDTIIDIEAGEMLLEFTTNGRKLHWQRSNNRGPQCKCHLTAREAQTSKLSILIIYQSSTCGGLKQNHSLKDQPRQLILNPQTSGRRGYLDLGPSCLCCPSERCPTFSSGSVGHPSFTQMTRQTLNPQPQNLHCYSHFHHLWFHAQRFSTVSTAILSSPPAQHSPVLLISNQTVRGWINHSAAYTHFVTQQGVYLSGLFLVKLNQIWCVASCCYLVEFQVITAGTLLLSLFC